MTIAEFTDEVVSYMNRTSALFTSAGGRDMVLAAMNDVRRSAQRDYTFESNRRTAYVELSLLGKSLLTDFDAAPNDTTTVVVKRVDAIWEYSSTTVSGTTAYYRTRELDFRNVGTFRQELPVRPDLNISSANTALNVTAEFAYLLGTKVYHSKLTTPTGFLADVVEFLPDLAAGGTPDIFLTYHVDWLRFATIALLNTWIKDSERAPLDLNMVGRLWESVKQFDSQMGAGTGSINLD
jgi:hypothetical protein